MTTIDDSTKNVLATITAQQAARRHSAPAWEHDSDPAITPWPMQSVASTESATNKKAKTKKSKKADDFKELNITRIHTTGGRVTYRVQIRRTVNGKSRSLCETFWSAPTEVLRPLR
ncbi:MAG: hypothetical protein ACU0B9_01655 [Limimaricola soesokkakensis]|uniref:hypothetical protein n=1 Tax=Limimaricola soesokkakensis TaxID=1343159 RepID=UPI004058DD16